MRLTEAIKLLTHSWTQNTILLTPDDKDALRLGIEALKKIDELHVTNVLGDKELLPGETKE